MPIEYKDDWKPLTGEEEDLIADGLQLLEEELIKRQQPDREKMAQIRTRRHRFDSRLSTIFPARNG